MIIGTGIDIIEIDSIGSEIKRKTFINRTFCPSEIEYCNNKPDSAQHFAARFAAKESAMKALGCGWSNGVQWRDIEVVKENGKPPTIVLHNKARELAEEKKVSKVWLSLSHCDRYATAMVIME